MYLAMVAVAERNDEFVAHFKAERTMLRESAEAIYVCQKLIA
jgi:hypothetical protein